MTEGLIAFLERRLSATAKISTALTGIGGLLVALAAGLLWADGIYVHRTVYAADRAESADRFDKSDLRALEGQLRNINGQILNIERLRAVTETELAFLKQLRADRERLEADVRELRVTIQERAHQKETARWQ